MLISTDAIQIAANRIQPYLPPTPVIRSDYYSQKTAANIFLKLDIFQPTHSFKVRGALNALLSLPEEQRQKGVITASQGNHGMGVIYAAELSGVGATVYLGKNAAPSRVQALEALGGEVVLYGDSWDEANRQAMKVAANEGKAFIHPFNNPNVMAGQATIFVELMQQMPSIDLVIASIGGGGLISGIISAVQAFSPKTDVIGVETIGADSMYQSVQAGHIVELPAITSIATSLGARRTEQTQFDIVNEYAKDVVAISDEMVVESLVELLNEEKLLVEPAASCTLSALTQGKIQVKPNANVAVIMCGANVTMDNVSEWRK
ncbi:MAG: pyridoxal-phosphate dependent enzyme [Anaerolineaceae bacterium]|nr:pyridoxal-phosphate dependent enzyme [Anaerolineaceae bacterium]